MNLYYRIKNIILDAWYNLRVRCQRFKRGYAYGDVWGMDFWFVHTVKPMLTHLRDYGHSVPGEFANNHEGWSSILTEMIECLNLMDEDSVYEHLGFDVVERITADDYKQIAQIMQDNKDRFFELFSKYFYHLWD